LLHLRGRAGVRGRAPRYADEVVFSSGKFDEVNEAGGDLADYLGVAVEVGDLVM
jgi:hypothetical protein